MLKTLNKKNIWTFMLMLIMGVMLIGLFSPTVAVASDDGGLFDDFDVNIDSEGEMKVDSQSDDDGAWTTLLTKYKGFIVGISAVGAITMVILFVMQFLKLGASAGNPNARSQALVGVLWTGIAAAGLGAVSLITGIFYNAI